MEELLDANLFSLQSILRKEKNGQLAMSKHDLTFWQHVIFSDEFTFVQFYVADDFNLNRLQPTIQHVRFSFLAWRVIWKTRKSKLVKCVRNLKRQKYIATLKKGILPTFLDKILNNLLSFSWKTAFFGILLKRSKSGKQSRTFGRIHSSVNHLI